MRLLVVLLTFALAANFLRAQEPAQDMPAAELAGKASDFWFDRNFNSYYWREDFFFVLTDDQGNRTRIISREPTPAYDFRMGTTFTELKVDWKSSPRVKVIGVRKVDRIPVEFYSFDLKDPKLVTALLVLVEVRPNEWKEWYVNNWFHSWGKQADRKIHALYADKERPYDIYGFARGQSAPFDDKSRKIIDANRDNPSLMFHGKVRSNPKTDFGYEVELIDLIGRDVRTGGHVLLHGDAKTIPRLDTSRPKK